MEIRKRIIVKILIVLISILLIDGGRTFVVVGNNIQILLSANHSGDIETPHQHNVIDFTKDGKFPEPVKFDFSYVNPDLIKFHFEIDIASQEFSDSVWQPPKTI